MYVSRRASDLLIARLRRNLTGLLYAGGRMPETGRAWVEGVERKPGPRDPNAVRWQVVSETGWTNIASRWPVMLVLHAPELHFRRDADGDTCLVEITP